MSGIVNQLGAVTGVVGTTSGADGFESDTKQVFHQTASPTGWTKLTASGTGSDSIDNICLRCVTGTITDGVGGTVAMTTALTSQAVAAHTIATNEMPAHRPDVTVACGSVNHECVPKLVENEGGWRGYHQWLFARAQCGGCHVGMQNVGGGGSHTHTAIDLAVKYVDVIVASKD